MTAQGVQPLGALQRIGCWVARENAVFIGLTQCGKELAPEDAGQGMHGEQETL
jgi:hypothetical protein